MEHTINGDNGLGLEIKKRINRLIEIIDTNDSLTNEEKQEAKEATSKFIDDLTEKAKEKKLVEDEG